MPPAAPPRRAAGSGRPHVVSARGCFALI